MCEHMYIYMYDYTHANMYINSYVDHDILLSIIDYIMLCSLMLLCYILVKVSATHQITVSNPESTAVMRASKQSSTSNI